MTIVLPSELERFVAQKIESGLFESADEMIMEGLRLLKERDEPAGDRRENLIRDIQIGIDQAEAGQVLVFDDSLLEAIKVKGRERLDVSKAEIHTGKVLASLLANRG